MALHQLYFEQKVPAPLPVLWDFISSPKNLQRITPEYMGFKILTQNLPEKMYPGMIVNYEVYVLPYVKMNWVTEITQVIDQIYFVDEQRSGPYKIWHHEHRLKEIEGGVLMSDLISYSPPFGLIGTFANKFIIKNQVNQIFQYRETALVSIFGEWNDTV
jgi:ligand-binding SRPBCC domain-containing protein